MNKQFSGNPERMEHNEFINICKTHVCEKSEWLHEEIIFCEGIVRFSSGIIWGLFINIIVFLATKNISYLLFVYALTCLVSGSKLSPNPAETCRVFRVKLFGSKKLRLIPIL